eukprot:2731662-Rhodomonas_salina.2
MSSGILASTRHRSVALLLSSSCAFSPVLMHDDDQLPDVRNARADRTLFSSAACAAWTCSDPAERAHSGSDCTHERMQSPEVGSEDSVVRAVEPS